MSLPTCIHIFLIYPSSVSRLCEEFAPLFLPPPSKSGIDSIRTGRATSLSNNNESFTQNDVLQALEAPVKFLYKQNTHPSCFSHPRSVLEHPLSPPRRRCSITRSNPTRCFNVQWTFIQVWTWLYVSFPRVESHSRPFEVPPPTLTLTQVIGFRIAAIWLENKFAMPSCMAMGRGPGDVGIYDTLNGQNRIPLGGQHHGFQAAGASVLDPEYPGFRMHGGIRARLGQRSQQIPACQAK
ncbi:hypothetical protein C8R43DRAFT_960607 [Mycena crocata]|nr:hypothetical protein C8R43DRAFT_960607 [Mycena crocata]